MNRTGSCFDNAVVESFQAVLKEEIGTRFWPDRATSRADIFDFVETPHQTPSAPTQQLGATSRPTRQACATSKIKPARRNNNRPRSRGNFRATASATLVAAGFLPGWSLPAGAGNGGGGQGAGLPLGPVELFGGVR